ncbi:MAG: tetratricopeptide repeat protein [Rhizomicrobium sp.]
MTARRLSRISGRNRPWEGLIVTRMTCAAFAAAVILSIIPARADDLDTCNNRYGAVAIDACTRLIESGSLSGDKRAAVFDQRGILYYSGDQYARAIQDFDEAIRLKPDYANAFYMRGTVEGEVGNTAAHDADFAKAKAIDPKINIDE